VEVAQLLGQLGVFLTCAAKTRPQMLCTCAWVLDLASTRPPLVVCIIACRMYDNTVSN
jgi:hypothetical protein